MSSLSERIEAEAERDARVALQNHRFVIGPVFDQLFGLDKITPPRAVEPMDAVDGAQLQEGS